MGGGTTGREKKLNPSTIPLFSISYSMLYVIAFAIILPPLLARLIDLISPIGLQAQVHRHAHNFREVQQCTLLSIKTGGCSEDCSYCPQSSRYNTGLKPHKLMNKDAVLEAAEKVY